MIKQSLKLAFSPMQPFSAITPLLSEILPMKTLAYLLILFSIVMASCHKDNIAENHISNDQVPNSTGDYWKYSIQSFTGEKRGFLHVQIIRKSNLPDGREVATWVYSYPEFTDTIYKIRSDTSFEEYTVYPNDVREVYPVMRYVFPMETGMKWAINSTFATDSVKVVSDTTVTIPAGVFAHSRQLGFIGTRFIGNYWNRSRYWFTPHIGITRMEYAVYSLGYDRHYGIYELVAYNLK
jgi:hypothetical protein